MIGTKKSLKFGKKLKGENSPSLVKPSEFVPFLLEGFHEDIDVIVAQAKRGSVRVDPRLGVKFVADLVQVLLREGWLLEEVVEHV